MFLTIYTIIRNKCFKLSRRQNINYFFDSSSRAHLNNTVWGPFHNDIISSSNL